MEPSKPAIVEHFICVNVSERSNHFGAGRVLVGGLSLAFSVNFYTLIETRGILFPFGYPATLSESCSFRMSENEVFIRQETYLKVTHPPGAYCTTCSSDRSSPDTPSANVSPQMLNVSERSEQCTVPSSKGPGTTSITLLTAHFLACGTSNSWSEVGHSSNLGLARPDGSL